MAVTNKYHRGDELLGFKCLDDIVRLEAAIEDEAVRRPGGISHESIQLEHVRENDKEFGRGHMDGFSGYDR